MQLQSAEVDRFAYLMIESFLESGLKSLLLAQANFLVCLDHFQFNKNEYV